jgi:hypothetical protein
MRSLALIAAGFATMLAGPALADPSGPPEQGKVVACLWAVVPDDMKAAVRSATDMDTLNSSFGGWDPGDEIWFADLGRRCGVVATADLSLGKLAAIDVASEALQLWAETRLITDDHVAPADLARAWRAVSPAQRAAMAAFSEAGGVGPAPADVPTGLDAVLKVVPAKDEAEEIVLNAYVSGRATVEAIGSGR